MGTATDFAHLGRKEKLQLSPDRPDLASAHILRSVANIKFTRCITSHSGCHAVFIDIDHRAWGIGRNEHHQLSFPLPTPYTTPASSTPAASLPFLFSNLPEKNYPQKLKSQAIVNAACGRNHTILVTAAGQAWTAGWNNLGQCGHNNSSEHISSFTRVGGDLLSEKVVSASAGITFSLFLTESGKIYAVGSGEKGQLGNGKTGEYIAASKVFFTIQYAPALIAGPLVGKKIVQIVSGQQHSVCLDDEGFCYAWGFGGLGRLGMGAQFDAFVPTIVPSLAGQKTITRGTLLAAGGTNTIFVDGQSMFSLCGKWKLSGDGSAGQPWMAPKLVQEIQGYKWRLVGAGGVTIFAATHDPKAGDFVISFGQGASHGELAQGEGSLKSATKPARIDHLDGIHMLDLACGQNTTFFIARPPATAADLASVSAPASNAIPSAPTTASAPAAAVASSSTPTVDLSGFGYDFAPPAQAVVVSQKAILPKPETCISRTEQEPWEALARYPFLDENCEGGDNCRICGKEEDSAGGEALECEMCEQAFHGSCLTPQIVGLPDGEWFCPDCSTPAPPPPAEVFVAEVKKRKGPPEKKVGAPVPNAKKRR